MRMKLLVVLFCILCVCVVPGAAQPHPPPVLPPVLPPIQPPVLPPDFPRDIDRFRYQPKLDLKPPEEPPSRPPEWMRWEYAVRIFALAFLVGLIQGLLSDRDENDSRLGSPEEKPPV